VANVSARDIGLSNVVAFPRLTRPRAVGEEESGEDAPVEEDKEEDDEEDTVVVLLPMPRLKVAVRTEEGGMNEVDAPQQPERFRMFSPAPRSYVLAIAQRGTKRSGV